MISKFLGTDRLNYIDVAVIAMSVRMFNDGHYAACLVTIVVGTIISVVVNGRAERQARKSLPHNTNSK
jgi:tetrahydromethanopterin S-methyltransferase subunit C